MAVNTLSLPVDIPWKRLCVSEDMIDRHVCDREFPYRWRSSIAVFSYQPPDEYQTYHGQLVSYLKVACTITGYQPDPDEVGIKDRRVDAYWQDAEPILNYRNAVNEYYPCYGAILEVSIAPSGSEEAVAAIPLSRYPYFADFEPKKRELYELVSESGETMSRSLDNVNVRKGTTTTESHEVVDMTTIGVTAEVGAGPASVGGSIQNESGTRDINQEERTNLRTTDAGREMRELYSHTTQLTQMYHQFTAYHLGTNRAVFFMLPRPHIKQSALTFVNGPRKLEGIQEIFLVVMRPKDMSEFCVDAYLETAHIAPEPQYGHRKKERTFNLTVESAAPQGRGDRSSSEDEGSAYLDAPDGWEVDIDRSGGYNFSVNEASRADFTVGATRDRVTARARVEGRWASGNVFSSGHGSDGILDMDVTVFLRKTKADLILGYKHHLYLTGRGVCCCLSRFGPPTFTTDSVVHERTLATDTKVKLGGLDALPVSEANQIHAEIGRDLLESVNHPDRYPRGMIGFADSQFLATRIAKLVQTDGHPDNQPVRDIKGLDPAIRDKVVRALPTISRATLLEMPPAEQIDRFELNRDEVRKLRRALLGLEGPLPEPRRRWDPLGSRAGTEQTVPNVVGLSFDSAQKLLKATRLVVGDAVYQDSGQPRGTVLNQNPNAKTKIAHATHVDLVLATGLSVCIPDVVGKPLTPVLRMLRDAGLESEPEITFAPSKAQPKNYVLEVTPEMRTYVTPHANVVLQVSSGGTTQKRTK